MKEYRTTYMTFRRETNDDPAHSGVTPKVPDYTDPDKWQLIGTTAVIERGSLSFTVFWTWMREEWWEPRGQSTQGASKQ